MTTQLIRLPSIEDGYDLYAIPPVGMSVQEAVAAANEIIKAANIEDHVNDGVCDDGLSVMENIQRRLGELGFVFPEIVDTLKWDDHFEPSQGMAP